MKNLFLLLCILFCLGTANAQTEDSEIDSTEEDDLVLVIPPINEKLKAGVKMGSGVGMMVGQELQNPRPKYIITGGAYLRYLFSKHWSLQPEVNVNFRGSNFNNGDGQYSSITEYALDVPLLIMYGLTKQNTVNILAGAQYSHTLNRSMYLKDSPVPASPTPSMSNDCWFVILGSQFHTPFIGFQVALKYGLTDLNTGLSPTLNPPNTGKDIHQTVLELNILF
jgi:hypothetical protein